MTAFKVVLMHIEFDGIVTNAGQSCMALAGLSEEYFPGHYRYHVGQGVASTAHLGLPSIAELSHGEHWSRKAEPRCTGTEGSPI